MNRIRTIINKINKQPKKVYNILCGITHESYQTELAKTGHNFYFLNTNGSKTWDNRFRPIPDNCYNIKALADDIEFDFILSQERFGQLQMFLDLSRQTRLPIIHMEHVEPQLDRWTPEHFKQIQQIKGDINVFITKHNQASWGYNESNSTVIPHGIDTELFSGWTPDRKNPYILYVVNQLEGRDYFCGYTEWKQIKEAVQKVHPELEFRLVGDNPGISRPPKTVDALVKQYQGCSAYINTSKLSPVPMSLLEAMSVGCPVYSTAHQEIPKILCGYEDKESKMQSNLMPNGVSTNNIDALIGGLISVYEKPENELANIVSDYARQTILDKFNLSQFITNWNKVFDQAYELNLGRQFDEIKTA